MKLYSAIFCLFYYCVCHGMWISDDNTYINSPQKITDLNSGMEGLFVSVCKIVSGWNPFIRIDGGYVNLLCFLNDTNNVTFYVNNIFPIQGISETIQTRTGHDAICRQLYDVLRARKPPKECVKLIPLIYEHCSKILASECNCSLQDVEMRVLGQIENPINLEVLDLLEAIDYAKQGDIDNCCKSLRSDGCQLLGDKLDEYINYLRDWEAEDDSYDILQSIYLLEKINIELKKNSGYDLGITDIHRQNSSNIWIPELVASGYQRIADSIFMDFMSSAKEYFSYFDVPLPIEEIEENPIGFSQQFSSGDDFFVTLRRLVHTEYLLAYDLNFKEEEINRPLCFISYYAMCEDCEKLWRGIADSINPSGNATCCYMYACGEATKSFNFSVLVGNIKHYHSSFERNVTGDNLKKILVSNTQSFF